MWSLAYNPTSVLVTGWDERTTLMLLGETGCVVHRNSVIFLQLSCKSETTLNVKVYLKLAPWSDLSTWEVPFIETGETDGNTTSSLQIHETGQILHWRNQISGGQLWWGPRQRELSSKQM